MWRIVQQPEPGDFILGTGETHTVREFVEAAFAIPFPDDPIKWRGIDDREYGTIKGYTVVKVDPKFYRPLEVDLLLADASKANTVLGWTPKTSFKQLVELMVMFDINNPDKMKEF